MVLACHHGITREQTMVAVGAGVVAHVLIYSMFWGVILHVDHVVGRLVTTHGITT